MVIFKMGQITFHCKLFCPRSEVSASFGMGLAAPGSGSDRDLGWHHINKGIKRVVVVSFLTKAESPGDVFLGYVQEGLQAQNSLSVCLEETVSSLWV